MRTTAGVAVRETVGGGGGVTVSVALPEVEPPAPEQDSE
jgi:hypothetical protein